MKTISLLVTVTATLALALFAATASQAALIPLKHQTDFTSAEDGAWTEGGNLGASTAWNAQDAWDTTDVSSPGYATVSTTFSRAINTGGGFTMAVGDSVKLNLTLNILGDWNESGNNDMLAVGLTDDFNSGMAVVRVGAGIRANAFADTLNFREQDFVGGNTVALNWDDITEISPTTATDDLDWTVTITKTATLNEFLVDTSISDTEGTTGSGSANFAITSSDLYGAGSIFPIVRGGNSLPGNGLTGVQIDTFTVGEGFSVGIVVPEPSTLLLALIGFGLSIFVCRLPARRRR